MFTKLEADITFSDIEDFCREFGESVRVEYKQEIKHIPKIVSSFANALGGISLLVRKPIKTIKSYFPFRGYPIEGELKNRSRGAHSRAFIQK